MVEVYALKEGMMLAHVIGCNVLIIQSDYMEVVETMKDGGVFWQRQLRPCMRMQYYLK